MDFIKRTLAPILGASIWISLSEFFRNEFWLKHFWTDHYHSLGLTFPSDPLNGVIWGLWSLFFSSFIFSLSRRFGFMQTVLIAWNAGFVMMWMVIGNLSVLPYGLLGYAIPLSLLEVVVATWIMKKLAPADE